MVEKFHCDPMKSELAQQSPQPTGDGEEQARSLLDQLLEDSRLYKSSEDYLKLLEFIARMRNFAPFNALLLQIQKPGLQFAASRHDWRERFQADVREDARPLLILWPFGPVALVYDVIDLVSGNIMWRCTGAWATPRCRPATPRPSSSATTSTPTPRRRAASSSASSPASGWRCYPSPRKSNPHT